MSRTSVSWRKIQRFFSRRDYIIYKKGGDTYIEAPKGANTAIRSRNVVRIGHKCSSRSGDEVYDCYLKNIENAFGVTREDILNG